MIKIWGWTLISYGLTFSSTICSINKMNAKNHFNVDRKIINNLNFCYWFEAVIWSDMETWQHPSLLLNNSIKSIDYIVNAKKHLNIECWSFRFYYSPNKQTMSWPPHWHDIKMNEFRSNKSIDLCTMRAIHYVLSFR